MTTSSARPDALVRYARVTGAGATRLEAAASRLALILSHFTARCTEYTVPEIDDLAARLASAAHSEAELAAWTSRIAEAFRAADRDAAALTAQHIQLGHWIVANRRHTLLLPPVARELYELLATSEPAQDFTWDGIALALDNSLALAELIIEEAGDAWPIVIPQLIVLLTPLLVTLGLTASTVVVASDGSRWLTEPVQSPADVLKLFHESFWRLMYHPIDESRLMSITERLDKLNRALCGALGTCTQLRPPAYAEPLRDPLRGTRDVTVTEMFDPTTIRHQGSDGRLYLGPEALMQGEHSLISYYDDEQVRVARVGAQEYAVGIAGLDPGNANGPNNFQSVARTAHGHTNENEYFAYVKDQFLDQLQCLPDGSTLHLAGHSMGGGMIMLMLNDPEVQRQLRSGNHTVASVTTFGAVRPDSQRANGVPPDEPAPLSAPLYADTIVNHYVDTDDALALNVGAGHNPQRFADVHLLDDGQITDPQVAHGAYDQPIYSDLPPQAQVLPFTVDPAYFEVYGPVRIERPLPSPCDMPPPGAG